MSGDRILRRWCLPCRCFSNFDVWTLEAGCMELCACLMVGSMWGWLIGNTKMPKGPRRRQEQDGAPKEPLQLSFCFLLPLLIVSCFFREWIAKVSGVLKGTSGGIMMRPGDFLFQIQLQKVACLSSVSCYHIDNKLALDSASWPNLVLILSSW